ncbi:TBC1 domain family member 17 [Clarias gariepinus]|uniref:TBC1 domain family member 17 n=1 Tax=Clarias gariepinus TaxID=13013 RepID=UPI00234C044A|nr:TBC1 domain family member 17 [Clarias gariepinus]
MDTKPENIKLIFEKEGVYLHTNAKKNSEETSIPGFIRIVERDGEPALEWRPVRDEGKNAPAVFYAKKDGEGGEEETNFDPGYEPDWAVISTVKQNREKEPVPIRETGQWGAFFLPLTELHSLRRARFSLGRNFMVLSSRGGDPLPPLHFHRGGTRELLRAMQRYIRLAPSPVDGRLFLAYPHDSGALSHSFDELQMFDDTSSDLVSRFIQDPYATTFGGFSKVTNFFRGALRPPESPLHSQGDPHAPRLSDDEPGFELITCQGAELGPRPKVSRGSPLDNWEQFLDSEGRVTNPQKVKELVFSGGIVPSLRKEVWKFLLGFYPWNSTAKEREDIIRSKTDEYFRMKVQWKSISEEQEMRNSLLRGYRSLIERDVNRTDRQNPFFSGSENPGLTLLHDVLMTYCMYNFDLGYVQGMSDLLAPILFVTQNEVESFWCLTGFMELVHQNFEESQEAMKQQLLQLSILLRALDPELFDYLDSQDSGSLCFCFRWLLIWYKREFSFEDILHLWEVLWTGLPCSNFHLVMACAILESQRGELIGSNHDFNTILKHINELTMKLDLQAMLREAEGIYLQMAHCMDLPPPVREVLGMSLASSSDEESSESEPKETDRLLSQSAAAGGVAACQSTTWNTPHRPPPTYP